MSVTECRVCGHKSPIGHDCKWAFDELKAENARLRKGLDAIRIKALIYNGIPEIESLGEIAHAVLEEGIRNE